MSSITLNLEPDATIVGSANRKSYRSIARASEGRSTALILAEDAEHIAVTGRGVIDGDGRAHVDLSEPHPLHFSSLAPPVRGRPFLIAILRIDGFRGRGPAPT